MKLIFALGNPGETYAATRHNVGWHCLDALAKEQGSEFTLKSKFSASIAEVVIDSEKTLLIKPQTFYNETGRSLRALMDFYKVTEKDILVLHDDLALEFGKLRIRRSGSDAGNNGIKSLNAHTNGQFTRLRIGIYNELRDRMPDADFVLARFNAAEKQQLNEAIIPAVVSHIHLFIAGKLEDTSLRP